MALFKGQDADLPLPTQLYQVAAPPIGWQDNPQLLEGTELETWLRRAVGETTWDSPVQWVEGLDVNKGPAWETRLAKVTAKPAQLRDDWRANLHLLARIYELNRRFLDEKADNERHQQGDTIFTLSGLLEDNVPVGIGVRYVPGGHFRGLFHERDQWFRTSEIEIEEKIKGGVIYLNAWVLMALRDIAKADTPVSRCPECKSAFVITRVGQTFCSHRCANRAGMRRRRTEQKRVLSKSA